jgi:short-subunit dehydrogenase
MKTAFITGGAQGIGLCTARMFIRQGYRVGIYDTDEKKLKEVFDEDTGIEVFTGSVTDPEAVKKALELFTATSEGKLGVLVNNAGIVFVGEYGEQPLENHLVTVDVNLKGILTVTYAALPFLKANNHSVIVNLSSASALYGNPEITTYAATKSAVRSLTEGWSLAFRKYGIRVADLLPIFVKTRMVIDNAKDYRKLNPDKVKLTPEMVAEVVWEAVNGKKTHYLVGKDTKIYALLLKWFPASWIPVIVRKVLNYRD